MNIPDYTVIQIPGAPKAITKGHKLKDVLNETAVAYMGRNISLVYDEYPVNDFYLLATEGLADLSLMARGKHIANALFETLPNHYEQALNILIKSMMPPSADSENFGLATMFYLPYSTYIYQYGLNPQLNLNRDPFDLSMNAQIELTKRFTAEFSIRPYLIADQERSLASIYSWLNHKSNHVRRLCTEGTRSRLPWGINIPSFIKDPSPIIPILEALKNDNSLYVRRSVANSLGDIAKDHPDLVFDICTQWLQNSDTNLKWLIRHAVRYHAKKSHPRALELRTIAKR